MAPSSETQALECARKPNKDYLEWITNDNSGPQMSNQVLDRLGLLFAAPMGLAFIVGFMKA